MVEKCANPACERPFRYLGRGRLFAFEVRDPKSPCKDIPKSICEQHPSHVTVCFWLCEQCAREYVVTFSGARGMQVLPRRAARGASNRTSAPRDFRPAEPAAPQQGGSYDPRAVHPAGDALLPGVPL